MDVAFPEAADQAHQCCEDHEPGQVSLVLSGFLEDERDRQYRSDSRRDPVEEAEDHRHL